MHGIGEDEDGQHAAEQPFQPSAREETLHPLYQVIQSNSYSRHYEQNQSLLQVQDGIESEYLPGILSEEQVEHYAIDMESVYAIHLHVDSHEHSQQSSASHQHHRCQ